MLNTRSMSSQMFHGDLIRELYYSPCLLITWPKSFEHRRFPLYIDNLNVFKQITNTSDCCLLKQDFNDLARCGVGSTTACHRTATNVFLRGLPGSYVPSSTTTNTAERFCCVESAIPMNLAASFAHLSNFFLRIQDITSNGNPVRLDAETT